MHMSSDFCFGISTCISIPLCSSCLSIFFFSINQKNSSQPKHFFQYMLIFYALELLQSQESTSIQNQISCMAVGARGTGPPVFSRSVNPIPTSGADYVHHVITCPFPFRPSYGPVLYGQSGRENDTRKCMVCILITFICSAHFLKNNGLNIFDSEKFNFD